MGVMLLGLTSLGVLLYLETNLFDADIKWTNVICFVQGREDRANAANTLSADRDMAVAAGRWDAL